MSTELGPSMRGRGELIGRLTEGAANGRGDLRVVTVMGEKKLKLADVPMAVAGDLARIRTEVETAIDRREWPPFGSIGEVKYDPNEGRITDWEPHDDYCRRSESRSRTDDGG